MPPLSFDKHGNLVPYEISIIDFKTFQQFFVAQFEDSIARGILHELYLQNKPLYIGKIGFLMIETTEKKD